MSSNRNRGEPVPPTPAEEATTETIIGQAEAALQVNRDQAAQNTAIITAAAAVIASPATSLTQPQLIAVLKDLARGVQAMAVHDQATKAQLNGLIRLVVGQFDAVD